MGVRATGRAPRSVWILSLPPISTRGIGGHSPDKADSSSKDAIGVPNPGTTIEVNHDRSTGIDCDDYRLILMGI